MKWIFEVEVSAKRNKKKILQRIIDRMEKGAMGDKQTQTVNITLIEEEEDEDEA